MKIIGIYKITNTITGDFYIGSSKNVKHRWESHKWPSSWKRFPNNPLYKDMRKYGIDKFAFEILEEVEEGKLKETEQKFIELLKPAYNSNRANGWDIERYKEYHKEYNKEYQKSEKSKEYQKEYRKTDKYKQYQKEYNKEYMKEYNKSDKHKEAQKKYQKSDKGKEAHNKYNNQLCFYNGETLTLNALYQRFRSQGIDHPTQEAKKYLIYKTSI